MKIQSVCWIGGFERVRIVINYMEGVSISITAAVNVTDGVLSMDIKKASTETYRRTAPGVSDLSSYLEFKKKEICNHVAKSLVGCMERNYERKSKPAAPQAQT